jgi:WD40 repeat protein
MSPGEPTAGAGTSAPPALAAAAQESVQEAVRAAASGRPGCRWVVPTAAVAAVAAAACAPVAWPLLAGGAAVSSAALAAAFGQAGGVGGGLLAEAVIRAWDRLRGRNDSSIGRDELREALAAELGQALGASSPVAAGLRVEVAGVLRGVDAVRVALTTTIETTVRESGDQIRAVLISGLQDLGSRFAEFGWLMGEVSDQVARIAEAQAELAAGTRAVLEGQQQALMQLTILRQEFWPVRARADLPETAGRSADADGAAALDAAGVPVGRDCPYPGLAAFGPQDAGRFFGRQQLTAVLITRLAEQLARPGLLMVLGPSGSGKSSLLRAGLLPAIAAGGLPARGAQMWPLDGMTPGRQPLLELATRIAAIAGIPAGALNADLHADPGRVTAAIRQALLAHARRRAQPPALGSAMPGSPSSGSAAVAGVGTLSSRLVLIVDQFEELFTQCPDERERRAFIRALCAAAGTTAATAGEASRDGGDRGAPGSPDDGHALVAIGIRADFYARCAAYPELAPYVQDSQVLVGPMDQAGLRAAITRPADTAGLVMDAGLVEVLLADLGVRSGLPVPAARRSRSADRASTAAAEVAGSSDPPPAGGDYEAGRLPLLAYALQQTWQYREGRRLTVAGYRATGGIDGAVAYAADAVYDRLDADGRQAARRLLLLLVSLGEGTADTRRRVTMGELTGPADLTTPAATSRAATERAVLTALIHARLLTADTSTDGSYAITISHEALLTAWPKLREWLSQDRAGQQVHRDLSDAARAWQAQHRDPSRLFSGTRLAADREWAAGHDPDLNPGERAFLAASLQQGRRSARRRRIAVTALAALTLVSAGTAGLAVQQNRHAQAERNAAIINEVTAEAGQLQGTDPSLAAQLDLVNRRLDPGPGNASVLLGTDNTPLADPLPGNISTVAYSPGGHTIATAGPDGAVRLWSLTDPADATPIGRPVSGHDGAIGLATFSPGGNILATVATNGTTQLWKISSSGDATPAGPPLTTSAGDVQSAAFSPDGDILATADVNGTIQLWTVTSTGDATPIGPLLTGPGGRIWSVAFSPDGRILAAGDNDGTIGLWNVSNPAHPATIGKKPLTGPTGPVFSVMFSPDGQVLAAGDGGGDDKVWLWNVTSPARAAPLGQPLTGPENTVSSVAFSPDGRILAAGSQDDKIRLWNVADPADPTPVGQPLTGGNSSGPVYAVAFSPDGRSLASASGNGIARLWSLPATVLTGQTGPVDAVAFSPDGQALATGSEDGTIQLWNISSPRPALLRTLIGSSGSVDSVAFSPDGHTLAAAEYGGAIQFWNVTSPADAVPAGQPLTGSGAPVNSVAFSPDGQTLAAGDGDGTVRLWNVASPANAVPIGQPLTGSSASGQIYSVAFSPDGHTLAAGAFNGTIALWNVASPADATLIGQPLTESTNNIFTLAFSPDGKTLAVSGADDNIGLWNVADPARASRIARLTGPTNAIQALAFSPDGKTLAAGSGDDTIWRWNFTRRTDAAVIGQPFSDASSVFALAFSPDSHALAAGSADGTAQIWDLNVDNAITRICAVSSDNLTPQQWAAYIPQLPYDPPCPHS